MQHALRIWVIVLSFALLGVLLVVGNLSYRSVQQLIAARESLTQAHKVLEEISNLQLLLDESESSARGFALTGRTEYLEPYEIATARLANSLQILQHDLAQTPAQAAHLRELEPILQSRLEVMQELIAARKERGLNAALEVVQSGRGKRLSDAVRERLSLIQSEEYSEVLRGEKDSREKARNSRTAVLLTTTLGIVAFLLASFFISRVISQREKLLSALHHSERLQRAILDSANFSIISTDGNGQIGTYNATAGKWLRYSPAEFAGMNIVALHEDKDLQERSRQLSKAMGRPFENDFQALVTKAQYGVPDFAEWTYRRKDGSRFPVSVSVTALREEKQTVSGYLFIARDLTEQNRLNRMKDEFVSLVSHELRTPLTAIRGALGLLASAKIKAAPEKAEEMLRIAANNSDRLGRLVDDILDLARLESGRIELHKHETDAARLMKQAVEAVQNQAETQGVTIETRPSSFTLVADSDRMIQTFTNLLTNAIKFSPRDSKIEFTAESNESAVRFKIRDFGRGIPPEKLETIFDRFEQVDASDSREKGGSGLGLAICRSIVEQHEGRIWAESTSGLGSTFWVELPRHSGQSSEDVAKGASFKNE